MHLYTRFIIPLALAGLLTTLATIFCLIPSFSAQLAQRPSEWRSTKPLRYLPAAVVGPLRHFSDSLRSPGPRNLSSALGVASRIYVLSLPRRTDRRKEMDRLARSLNLDLTYVDAADATDSNVANIMHHVRMLRSNLGTMAEAAAQLSELGYPDLPTRVPAVFGWPPDLRITDLNLPAGAELWPYPSISPVTSFSAAASHKSTPATSLACYTENNVFGSITEPSKAQNVLNLPKLACWYSHLQLLRRISECEDERPSIVLEDDVDMERDIHERLQSIWDALPSDWDIVYLGHCWSNETEHQPLRTVAPPWLPNSKGYVPSMPSDPAHRTSLHPASGPKCTHAYALSRHGARRLLAHLRHPPFAYSRAIDQAMAWLVRSDRLNAFSIVPPVVVQRKMDQSDLMPGNGSRWRDNLYDGVLT
ncbi:unnamed protein product [Peniophora sp. CBMAI 1063]|nr:unnamed protein product [Peniophora sp. CBMAI 1063]